MSHESLIHALGADLKPVKPLRRPLWRALVWLAWLLLLAIVLALFADTARMMKRLMEAPDLWLAAMGSMATAVLAAIAVFELSLPDGKSAWAFLPLPGALLWIGASGAGCLRTWLVPDTHAALMREASHCLLFIVALSVPLSIVMIAMLRRAYSLRPGLTAAVGGLAIASASATLLNFFHPFDAAATDLAVHAFAVGLVVILNGIFGGRLLRGKQPTLAASALRKR